MVAHARPGQGSGLLSRSLASLHDEPLTRGDLLGRPSRLLSSGRNRTKAEVRLFDVDGQGIVLKDFRGRDFLVRNTVGRFSVSRECRAYRRLASVGGIPSFHGRLGPYALAYAYVPGRPLPDHGPRSLPASFFAALDRLLEGVHGRGIAVADLHHRNVIVTESGEPTLIDFSLAMAAPAAWNPIGRRLYKRAQQLDRLALERIRRRYEAAEGAREGAESRSADGGTPAQDREIATIDRLHALGRGLKRVLGWIRRRS